MADIEYLYSLYNDNLANRTLQLDTREIGGNRRRSFTLHFYPENASHLIGEDSNWHDQKVEAFRRMCFVNTWQMAGDYVDSMGDLLSADILVGGQNCVFGFRELDDGIYVPVTCLLVDIRDYVYNPVLKIDNIIDL